MKIAKILVALLLISLCTAHQASAQTNRALEQLSELNRINPLQNPEFDRSDKILKRKIIDRKNKVVGRVDDIIVNQNGTIASLKTDFDRLRLGSDINLNYRNLRIKTASNAYTLGMDSDEIVELFPQLLANIETASGSNDNAYSVEKLVGSSLRAKDGRRIGKVDSILFGANGGIVRAIYAELTYGTLRGETIAIPFRSANFKMERGRLIGTLDNQFADAVIEVADD